jgi:adenylate kinase family enzyme
LEKDAETKGLRSNEVLSKIGDKIAGGLEITDDLLVNLLVNAIRECEGEHLGMMVKDRPVDSNFKGWAVVNFPRNLAQAQAFEKQLSGYVKSNFEFACMPVDVSILFKL